MTSVHLSIRIDSETMSRLDKVSRHMGSTRSELAKTLIEEGLRMEAHPGIIFKPGPAGRRPAVLMGPDVWEIVTVFRDFKAATADPVAATAEWLSLHPGQVQNALGYYSVYADEIDAWIRDNEDEAREAEAAWEKQQQLIGR